MGDLIFINHCLGHCTSQILSLKHHDQSTMLNFLKCNLNKCSSKESAQLSNNGQTTNIYIYIYASDVWDLHQVGDLMARESSYNEEQLAGC